MSVSNVVKVSFVIEVSNCMKEITRERNPLKVNAVKFLVITITYNYTEELILERNPMNAKNVGKP